MLLIDLHFLNLILVSYCLKDKNVNHNGNRLSDLGRDKFRYFIQYYYNHGGIIKSLSYLHSTIERLTIYFSYIEEITLFKQL